MSGPSGLLNLLKPPGMTSHDVVEVVRESLPQSKVGHAGTLDPGAAGVLVLALGKATRVMEWLKGYEKLYRAEMLLGLETDTHDLQGQVVAQRDASAIGLKEVEEALVRFQGEIEQYPPAVSAKRFEGRRGYELVREGKEVPLKPIRVRIASLRLLEFRPGPQALLRLDVHCSAGTYVRSLCRDLGQALGCGGTLAFLLRLRVGPFRLEEAHTLEEWQEAVRDGRAASLVQPLQVGLAHLPRVRVSWEAVRRAVQGQWIRLQEVRSLRPPPGGWFRLETPQGALVALAELRGDVLVPRRVLMSQEEVEGGA